MPLPSIEILAHIQEGLILRVVAQMKPFLFAYATMNYKQTYDQLIEKRRRNPLSKGEGYYCERHHIRPKSEGGSDDETNLVNLTAREHYIAHLLLARIYDDQKMWCAVQMMLNSHNHEQKFKFNSHLYEAARVRRSKMISGANHPLFGTHLSEETRRKISESTTGRQPWNVGKHHTEETKSKLRRPKSEEHRMKLREALKGKKQSIETRKKRSESMRGKPSPRKGKHLTEEQKKHLSLVLKGRAKSALTREQISSAAKCRRRDADGRFIDG